MQTAEMVPSPGTPETFAERLRAYVTIADAGWSARVRGASKKRIDRYLALACGGDGSILPSSYSSFARLCGEDDGGLFKNIRITTSLENLIVLYEGFVEFERECIVKTLPVVACYIVGDQVSLDCRQKDADPQVLNSSMGEPLEPLSSCWEHLCMQAAVLFSGPRRFREARGYSSSAVNAVAVLGGKDEGRRVNDAVDRVCAAEGLTSAWISDSRHRVWSREGVLVYAETAKDETSLIHVFGDDPVAVRKLGDTLGAATGALVNG